MNTPVKVTAKDGQVVIASENKPEFGYVRVEQITTSFDGGWANRRKKSALIRGKVDELKQFGWKEGQALPGHIVTVESTVEPYPGADPKINPQTGEILTHNGEAIYRESFYTTNMQKVDELLQHDTVSVGEAVTDEATAEFEPSIEG